MGEIPGRSTPARQKWTFEVVDPDDVYLVSFPRSGNTWLRFLITSLLRGERVDAATIDCTVPDIHRSDPSVRPNIKPFWVKSHMPPGEAPRDVRVIYLVRHGLDAMLSYHRYLQARGHLSMDVDAGSFLWHTEVWPCPWGEHVGGWLSNLEQRPAQSRLLVRYEDLVARPRIELARIGGFLGLEATANRVEQALSASGREQMRHEEQRAGAGALNLVGSGEPRRAGEAGVAWCQANAAVLERAGYRV